MKIHFLRVYFSILSFLVAITGGNRALCKRKIMIGALLITLSSVNSMNAQKQPIKSCYDINATPVENTEIKSPPDSATSQAAIAPDTNKIVAPGSCDSTKNGNISKKSPDKGQIMCYSQPAPKVKTINIGTDKIITDYVYKNLKYPALSRKKRIEGSVYVEFSLSTNGKVLEVKVSNGVNGELDNEAARLVKSIPHKLLMPYVGTRGNSKCLLVVNFKLQGNNN